MIKPGYQLTIDELFKQLKTGKEGLANKEAEQRLKSYGKNILAEIQKTPKWLKFFQQFKDVLIILLIASMLVSIYLDDTRWATILWVIIIINAAIWYIQEAKAEKIMDSLKSMMNPIAKVKRNWKLIEASIESLVPGDIVYIEEWDNIPADLRIFEENNLQANDFSLTWESNSCK